MMELVRFDRYEIRRVWSEERQRWGYVGQDAAVALGYADPKAAVRDAVKRHPGDFNSHSWVGKLPTQGQRRPAKMFSKQGLYKLGMLADTERAVPFRDWVANTLTDLDEGRLALMPGPNADPDLGRRLALRPEVTNAFKGAHSVIDAVGGGKPHHMNLEKNQCRHLRGVAPKQIKEGWGMNHRQATADRESALGMGYRITVGTIFMGQHRAGGISRENLKEKIKAIPADVAAFMETQIGKPLLDLLPRPDVRPHLRAAEREEKRLATGAGTGQMRLLGI